VQLPRWPSLTIRATVLLAITAAVLLPTLVLLHLEQRLTRAANEPLIAQNRHAVLLVAAGALTEPLWTLDSAAVDRITANLVKEPAVLGLTLTERRPLVAPRVANRPGAAANQAVALSTPILREGELLGTLEVRFDARQIDHVIAERQLATIVLAVLQVAITSLVLLGVLYRRLIGPIERLKGQASAMASRDTVVPVRWSRHDELGQLGKHLNRVHNQIGALFRQLERQHADMAQIAMHDALTGLPNRAQFQSQLAQAIDAARASQHKVALLFIDLDRFKSINDTMGHSAGDVLLQSLASRLRNCLGEHDVLCRYSGDEFVVLLREANRWDDVAATADRLLKAVEVPVFVKFRDLHTTDSIGIALFPQDADNAEDLVRNADTAMYQAKHLGRARVSFFRAEFNSQLHASLQLEQELKVALAEDQFVLHYQPQVSATTGQLVGCEALIRWQHPERGLVPPMQFIGVAEQCGLIGDLGAWTIRHACAQIQRWKRDGVPFVSVAVNVSALEFRQHRLVDTLTQAMIDYDIQPHELELEITESVLMTDTDTTQRIVDDLHQLNLRLAVDDFGTGYSSLAYLKRLRPSKIKIDRSFVRDLPDDDDDRVLVRAVVQLASAMGLKVVAEGVETPAQQAFLCETGCDVLQGYLISRPQPSEGFAAFALGHQHKLPEVEATPA
jgi:diguanylate cyclase (GGDEF)-like protein